MYNDAHEKSWQVYGEYMMHGLAQNSSIYRYIDDSTSKIRITITQQLSYSVMQKFTGTNKFKQSEFTRI